MRKVFLYLSLTILSFNMIFSADRSLSPVKQSKYKMNKIEPETVYNSLNNSQHNVSREDGYDGFARVDSSMNGYGLLVGSTLPLIKDDNGWFATYRQYCGPTCTSGQIGAAYSGNGEIWTTYTNLNPSGQTGSGGDGGVGRYPSSLGNTDYPFAFWNEYTGTGSPSYGGRPFYAFDEFGWDGGSFSDAQEVDLLWNDSKDLWVGSPALSYDNGNSMFNVAYADWTRSDVYVFHSEAYQDGYVIYGEEMKVIDETTYLVGGDDEGSYTSSPVLDVNESGVGYCSVTAYWSGGDVGASEYSNSHTAIFAGTDDHGASWTGGTNGAPYYYIPDNVYQHMIDSETFPLEYYDEEFDTTYTWTELFAAYDYHMRVDASGDPHFVLGLVAAADDGVFVGITPEIGYYHFTIDRNFLSNPGDPQTAQGWNYSFVTSTQDTYKWDLGSFSGWQFFYPHLAISEENEDVMYVVSSMVNEGEEDPLVPGSFPEWSIDTYVMKSEDGGASWWCPLNVTNTSPNPADDSYTCPDGLTTESIDEHAGHAGTGATDNDVPVLFNRAVYCDGVTTDDTSPADYKNRIYIGLVGLDSEPQCGDCPCAGDSNNDGNSDVLDIVSIVNTILGSTPPTFFECAADQNGDGSVDVLDIVAIVNCILSGGCDCDGSPSGRTSIDGLENATSAKLVRSSNSLNLIADGFVGGVQMTLSHSDDFSIELTQDFVSESVGFSAYKTNGNTTTLIIIAPKGSHLFEASSDFEVVDVVAASGNSYINLSIVDKFALLSNYPNPFNPETQIDYELHVDGQVDLSIYNINGQLVSNLVSSNLDAGSYNVIWNGMDSNGAEVASGVYIMQLKTANEIISNKITLLR